MCMPHLPLFIKYELPTIILLLWTIKSPSISAADSSISWHYEEGYDGRGPSEWFKIPGSELCGIVTQSPIQITPSNFIFNTTCNTPLNWNIDNTTYNFTISHKGEHGYTILLENNLLPSNININNEYLLHSLHFHWGNDSSSGSEHIFTDITTTLELHFVHYSINYSSPTDAVESWHNLSESDNDINTLSVIGILFEEVNDNDAYNIQADNIITTIATDAGMDQVWRNATGQTYLSFAMTNLFDIDNLKSNYYSYDGSLTTPPCTPTVRWYLGQTPIKIRHSTMDLFRRETIAWETATGRVDADRNFRPIQNNPNCIHTCIDNPQLKYCPDIIEDIQFPDTYWHYEDDLSNGPSDWSNIVGGELCAHIQQSPILIKPSDFDLNRHCNQPLEWIVDNTVYNWSITHKGEAGHTLKISNTHSTSDVYLVNRWQKKDNYQHARYNLYAFHAHWGPGSMNGSEHVFDGVTTQLEVHFVHYSQDYLTAGEAVNAWQNLSESDDPMMNDMHTLAVAGFLFEEVGDNEEYNVASDNIILQMAVDNGMDMLWQNATGVTYLQFAITDLVDIDDFMMNYYYYEGSLTTPPCTPAVRWHLAQNTVKIRKSTMDLFRAETRAWKTAVDGAGDVDADRNFRPIQTNPNCIYTCGDRWCPYEEGIDYPEWHYEDDLWDGPSNWYKINKLCAHPQQSPILIDPNDFTDNDICAVPLNWHVDNTVYNWTVTHKGEHGHTLDVYNYDAKHDIYLHNSFQYDGNTQHDKYKLYSLHFHWGPNGQSGSEHIFKHVTTTLEIHFVLYSSDYNSIVDAITDWERLSESTDAFDNDMHTLGVVGFLCQEVEDNEIYNTKSDKIIRQFANNYEMNQVWSNASGKAHLSFSITDLVDVEDFENNYYHYWGSLTTPPCTPAVSWHLAQNTIKIRKSTMELFRIKTKLWQTAAGAVDADKNYRPVQSNPSCISICSSDKNMEYCPDVKVEGKKTVIMLLPLWLWIVLGILGGLLIFGIPIYIYFRVCKKENKNSMKGDQHEKVPNNITPLL